MLLQRLKAAQQTHATEALRHPGNKTEYDFGFRVGVMAGLDRAEAILLALLDEERNSDKDL